MLPVIKGTDKSPLALGSFREQILNGILRRFFSREKGTLINNVLGSKGKGIRYSQVECWWSVFLGYSKLVGQVLPRL